MKNSKCEYNGKEITVEEYFEKRGVKAFEKALRQQAASCSLFRDGNCLMSDEPCKVLNEGFPTHPKRRCIVFERMVLPADQKTQADYWAVFAGEGLSQVEKRNCEGCGKPIDADSPNRRYCGPCKRVAERASKRNRMRRYREGKEDF
ncbi:hypothetical protein D0469_03510 [Peribacillus saganii]|uniref:Cysteine-rich VLP domain-containing protein n=1 Tax=Peribacillus saganii TaxID=2303992 RepID=A0A372LT97_9BACI|nr:hypothetical protein [Peribacillus saganii]RFU71020.1 hypothetical protein D0469_03510 [Peribacillus saganii]